MICQGNDLKKTLWKNGLINWATEPYLYGVITASFTGRAAFCTIDALLEHGTLKDK